MPKKSKTGQGAASNGSSDLKRKRRSTSTAKSTGAAKKKQAAKAVKSSKPVPVIEPSDEEIRLRAYFIAERRTRLALPGDSDTDWLEAKRQLLSELGPR